MPFFSKKGPFCLRKKGLLRDEKKALLRLKVPLFKVEKCPFSLKSAFLVGNKRPFTGRIFFLPFYAEKEKNEDFFRLKVPFFKDEKCPFSLKSAFLF